MLLPVWETALRFKPQRIARNLPTRDSASPLGDRIDPAARPAGFEDDVLKTAMASAFEGDGVQNQTRGLVVLYNGQLIAERYADGFRADMPLIGWSMGKTITFALLDMVASAFASAASTISRFHNRRCSTSSAYAPSCSRR